MMRPVITLDLQKLGAPECPQGTITWGVDGLGRIQAYASDLDLTPEPIAEFYASRFEVWNWLLRILVVARAPWLAREVEVSELYGSWFAKAAQTPFPERVISAWMSRDHDKYRHLKGATALCLQIQRRVLAALRPHLNHEAIHITHRARGGQTLYNHLAASRWVLEAAQQNFVVAQALVHIAPDADASLFFPRGRSLATSVAALLGRIGARLPLGITPGFMPSAAALCFHSSPKTHTTSASKEFWSAEDCVALTKLGDAVDVNRLRQLNRSQHRMVWQFLDAAPRLIPAYLRNPDAAHQAIVRYFRAKAPEGGQFVVMAQQLFSEILDTCRDRNIDPTQYGFVRLVRDSDRYHRELRNRDIADAIREASKKVIHFPEPPFFGICEDGLQMVWLSDNVQLAEEGARMEHCVGSYASLCEDGSSVIYSVRGEGEIPRATIEVDNRMWIKQIRGPRNALVPEKLEHWIRGIFGAQASAAELEPGAVA